jgi:predicted ATPase
VLVTSRALLQLRGEHEFPVPPLAVPDPQRLPPVERLSQYAAVALFLQQATAARSDFAITDRNAPAVAEICHRLDGLPLAIELAAARVKVFAPEALLSRLAHRLKLLVGGARDLPARQQTLRDAIAWSHDLLEPMPQMLFRRLAVFVGGFTLEAAEAVCAVEGDLPIDVLEGVASLADQSLLRREERAGSDLRFGMLETIQEYALERLEESDEAETLRQQHARYFLQMAEQAEPVVGYGGPDEAGWLERLAAEYDNLRAVLDGAMTTGQTEVGLRLAGALREFWLLQGYLEEGQQRVVALLAGAGAAEPSWPLAKALRAAGWLAFHQHHGRAPALLEESLAMERQLGNKLGIAESLFHLAVALVHGPGRDRERARHLLEASLALYHELGHRRGMAWALRDLGKPHESLEIDR